MKNRLITIISAAAIFLLSVLLPAAIHAEEIIDNDFGYSLDIPEGYKVIGYTPDGMSYQFKHDRLPVNLVLKLYPQNTYSSSKIALKETLKKLSATFDSIDTFIWQEKKCAITIFDSKATNPSGSTGWSIGVPLKNEENILVLLCYADAEKAKNCEQFIISTLNSLIINEECKKTPGIITTYAFPGSEKKEIEIEIAGKTFKTTFDKEDSAANQFVIDCEFAVLENYANNEKWKEAWTRYYRAVYRDSYKRIDNAATDIKENLSSVLKRKNKTSQNIAINEILLEWVQNFDYVRNADKRSDFTNIIDAICGKGNDCDSRSMLMSCLMEHYGVKSELFISKHYSHAVYGLDLDIPGAKINVNGKDFLLNETTAKGIKPGLIAQDQSDTTKWIPVLLP